MCQFLKVAKLLREGLDELANDMANIEEHIMSHNTLAGARDPVDHSTKPDCLLTVFLYKLV